MTRGSWFGELIRRPYGAFGLGWLALIVLSAAVSLVWTPHDPFAADPYDSWLGPSGAHLFGTDSVGRDIFSYVFSATRTTVIVAAASGATALVVGVALSALGALTGRWLRESTAVLLDILIAFPTVLIAMALAAVFGGSLVVVVVSVGIAYGVNIARVSRGEIRRVARTDYVLAARANGLGSAAVLRRHVLPNTAPTFVVQLSLSMATSILAEAGLSFLGYGAPASVASWGRLLSDLQRFIGVHPWSAVWPGLAITLTVLAFNLLGDALREATDPRLRSSGRRPAAEAPRPGRPGADDAGRTTPGVTA
ncbi:ABC transporter permease [Frigoribacterium sp. 2-23]|uniref:ABC transporter permease n=1 Tax=Frigoribacterium sp. 2-23 TaxID=3415006 RepID=UPI003C6FF551